MQRHEQAVHVRVVSQLLPPRPAPTSARKTRREHQDHAAFQAATFCLPPSSCLSLLGFVSPRFSASCARSSSISALDAAMLMSSTSSSDLFGSIASTLASAPIAAAEAYCVSSVAEPVMGAAATGAVPAAGLRKNRRHLGCLEYISTSASERDGRPMTRRQRGSLAAFLASAPFIASSGNSPRNTRWAVLAAAPSVAATISSAMLTEPAVSCPGNPATMPGFCAMRFASSLAFIAEVNAPTTLRVGHGDLGWLAGGHSAPVTMLEYLNSSCASSLFNTLSDWSFS
mmetsp:Transcript_68887/g.143604  ORF Transcript_68887/g.143604 Transcript_68887/m.143604 type:complete len:285 (+) Transcript_68887:296-1150(+)